MTKIHMPMAEGYTRRCDPRKSLVQVDKVAGATSSSRRYDLGESLVRLDAVAGATGTSRWCGLEEAPAKKNAAVAEKSAHFKQLDVNACSSSDTKTE